MAAGAGVNVALEGISHQDFETLVGGSVDRKVLFFNVGSKLYYRMGDRWFEGQN